MGGMGFIPERLLMMMMIIWVNAFYCYANCVLRASAGGEMLAAAAPVAVANMLEAKATFRSTLDILDILLQQSCLFRTGKHKPPPAPCHGGWVHCKEGTYCLE